MKKQLINKKIITGAAATLIFGCIAGASVGIHNNNKKNVIPEVKESEVIVNLSGVTEYSSACANRIVQFALNDDNNSSVTGKTEVAKGMAAKLEAFCASVAGTDERSDEVSATVDEIEATMKLEPEQVESVVSGYKVLGISNTGTSYLNIRAGAGTKYKKVGTMPGYSACEILETIDNGWYKIKSGEVEGYVSAEYILTGAEANKVAKEKMEKVAVVSCDVLNVRTEPNTNCKVFTSVKKDEAVEIEEELNGWYKININNLEGYVSSEYITYITKLPTAEKIVEVTVNNSTNNKVTTKKYSSKDFASGEQTVSQTVKDLIDYALQFLGNPYVYGGNSLTNGTDCSGFTKLIFAHFGYTLGRTCQSQLSAGKIVPLSEVKPGDLLLYSYNGRLGHVAIYIGNGKIVHASTPKGGIRIGNALYTTPAYAVRVIN